MRHRPAVTLIEVLMAIFVMGLGMLALLVLFPLGALSVAQALRDDRAAQAAANASAMANAMDIRHDPDVMNAFSYPFRDPTYNLPPQKPPTPGPWTGPGWPVYVDPFYANTYAELPPLPLTGAPGIPRMSLKWLNNNIANGLANGNALTTRWFTLLDDLTFTSGESANGTPEPGNFVKRGGRYTWAFMLKPVLVSNQQVIDPVKGTIWAPKASVVDLSVVVYSGRQVFNPPREPAMQASGEKGSNTIIVSWDSNQDKPAFRKGVWILDETYDVRESPVARSDFYRVVGVTDLGSEAPGSNIFKTQLEIQGTLKSRLIGRGDTPSPPTGTIVLMEQVVEVFDRGSGWKP
jgi:hypothetical protein